MTPYYAVSLFSGIGLLDLGLHRAGTPLRCYCGHESCWAFASWEPLPPRGALAPTPVTTRRNAWATREESTWIDKL